MIVRGCGVARAKVWGGDGVLPTLRADGPAGLGLADLHQNLLRPAVTLAA